MIGQEPSGFVRFDAEYRKAEALRHAGRAIRIVSERQLIDELLAVA